MKTIIKQFKIFNSFFKLIEKPVKYKNKSLGMLRKTTCNIRILFLIQVNQISNKLNNNRYFDKYCSETKWKKQRLRLPLDKFIKKFISQQQVLCIQFNCYFLIPQIPFSQITYYLTIQIGLTKSHGIKEVLYPVHEKKKKKKLIKVSQNTPLA